MAKGDVEQCYAALAGGQLTTGAVAKLTGQTVRAASANLQYLYQQGRVKREPYHKTGPKSAGPQVVWGWTRC